MNRSDQSAFVIDVIIPALNEATTLPWLLGRMPDRTRAIVVDNNSTDDTADVARSHGAVVITETIPGYGSACWAGLNAATSEIVCFLDADGSTDPADLPKVFEPLLNDEYDLVLGARQSMPGAMNVHERLGIQALTFELRRRSNIAVTDLGPTRAVRREALLALGMLDRRSGWPLEMIVRGSKARWRILEVGIPHRPQDGRTSRVTGSIKGTLRALNDIGRVLANYDESPNQEDLTSDQVAPPIRPSLITGFESNSPRLDAAMLSTEEVLTSISQILKSDSVQLHPRDRSVLQRCETALMNEMAKHADAIPQTLMLQAAQAMRLMARYASDGSTIAAEFERGLLAAGADDSLTRAASSSHATLFEQATSLGSDQQTTAGVPSLEIDKLFEDLDRDSDAIEALWRSLPEPEDSDFPEPRLEFLNRVASEHIPEQLLRSIKASSTVVAFTGAALTQFGAVGWLWSTFLSFLRLLTSIFK